MGARINAIKSFLGIGKSAMASAKEAAVNSNPIKTVSDSSVKNMQDAAASYGKADVILSSGKKVYQKPEVNVQKIKMEDNLMAASGVTPGNNTGVGIGGEEGGGSTIWGGGGDEAKPHNIWDAWEE